MTKILDPICEDKLYKILKLIKRFQKKTWRPKKQCISDYWRQSYGI